MKVHYERIPLRRQDGGEVDPYDPLSASAGIAPAGTPTVDQIPWNQPSWLEQADEQSRRDQEAYEREGIPGLLRDTSTTQDLASGFGGGAGIAGTTKAVGARVASAPPLYSAVEEAVANAKSPQAPAPQWLGMIRNTPGVKPEELEHLGVEDFLKNQKGPVSKEALREHIAGNKVDVQEVMKGAPRVEEPAILAKRFYNDHNPGYSWDDLTPERQQEWIRSAQEHQQQGYSTESPTKFQQYTLPGGENYRELLLTLPEKSGKLVQGAGVILLAGHLIPRISVLPTGTNPTSSPMSVSMTAISAATRRCTWPRCSPTGTKRGGGKATESRFRPQNGRRRLRGFTRSKSS
jgi:hypothetical protein